MKISDIYKNSKTVLSFEVFPPKPGDSLEGIYATISEIKVLEPDFISVTYGAAGGTKERTVEISSVIKSRYSMESLMHLTCVNSSREDIEELIGEVKETGIENILALRGDMPENNEDNPPGGDFSYASELVDYIKKEGGLCVGVAGYPEQHPESADIIEDVKYLKKKVDAGADFIISQLFFLNEYFYEFMENIRGAGIDIPVSAGIMPVFRASIVEKMVSLCGASIPAELRALIDRYGDKHSDMEKAGIDYAAQQISGLMESGSDGIHIYIMNRPGIAKKLVELI